MSEIAEAGAPKTHTQPASPYELLGGGPVIASIVARFYDLVDQDPACAPARDACAGSAAGEGGVDRRPARLVCGAALDPELAHSLAAALERMARAMVNRPNCTKVIC